ncbi:hypothetical protein [uncultured Brevundimonas sp.]|uniref:hypothetical protein n=1 Tax=uncultured Brevundimonas sp. TaxID=213418 RepID=UPI00262A5D06|nr:hypothetical protein [uncultured Brevundimonas sp.]
MRVAIGLLLLLCLATPVMAQSSDAVRSENRDPAETLAAYRRGMNWLFQAR